MFVNEWRKELARFQGRVVHNVETGVSWGYGYYYAVAGKMRLRMHNSTARSVTNDYLQGPQQTRKA